jgi:hypothetical protein
MCRVVVESRAGGAFLAQLITIILLLFFAIKYGFQACNLLPHLLATRLDLLCTQSLLSQLWGESDAKLLVLRGLRLEIFRRIISLCSLHLGTFPIFQSSVLLLRQVPPHLNKLSPSYGLNVDLEFTNVDPKLWVKLEVREILPYASIDDRRR